MEESVNVTIPLKEYEKMKSKLNELCENQSKFMELKSSDKVVLVELGRIEVELPHAGIRWRLPSISPGENERWEGLRDTIDKVVKDAKTEMGKANVRIHHLEQENNRLKDEIKAKSKKWWQ